MNTQTRKLAEQAGFFFNDYNEPTQRKVELLAELIVRECAAQCLSDDCMRILIHFGVEESTGWVCPKCGTDRTKAACPQGHTAALTGDCPMYGVAHGVEK